MIKAITYKFEDQKFLPLALLQAKLNLFMLCQGTMPCHDYHHRFRNLVDIALTYNGQIHDQAIVDIVTERAYPGDEYNKLRENRKRRCTQLLTN